uniref:Basal endosperm transfer layer 1 n=1 Tax=Zea mays TaxID=4577 RepID=H9TVI8_MAIZE|nr:basal endosperm transfer layer 1 [Zea mays]
MAVMKSSTMVALLLAVAILSSLSPCYEAGGCIGKPKKSPPPPRRPYFSSYSEDHQNCRLICSSKGFKDGGWCDESVEHKVCCCSH